MDLSFIGPVRLGGFQYNDDIRVYDINADVNGTAVLATGGAGFKFFGGLIQSNTDIGMNFIPDIGPSSTVGNIQGITVENIWFENNKNFAIQFDTSNGNIENVSVDKCRFAITDNGAFNFVNTGITTGIYNLIFGSGNHIIGNGTITIPSYVSGRSEILTGGQLFVSNSSNFALYLVQEIHTLMWILFLTALHFS